MPGRHFWMDFSLGLNGLIAGLALLVGLSYVLGALGLPLVPLLVNLAWAVLLGCIVWAGIAGARAGLIAAPVVFLALWALFSQVHAGLLSGGAKATDGLNGMPDVKPVRDLIVLAPAGLLIDPERTGGVQVARADQCGLWCRDLLVTQGIASVTLRTPKPGNPEALTRFRKGDGPGCASARDDACAAGEAVASLPDGLLIEMGEDASQPTGGGICCTTAAVERVTAGKRETLARFAQGNRTTVMPFPLILAAPAGPKGESSPWFLMRDVPLGQPVRFDTVLEAVIGKRVAWAGDRAGS